MATATLTEATDYNYQGTRYLRDVKVQVSDEVANYLESTGKFVIGRAGVKITKTVPKPSAPAPTPLVADEGLDTGADADEPTAGL